MKIALIGYGKMGKRIHALTEQTPHEVVAVIDSPKDSWDKVHEADLCMEFTTPSSCLENCKRICELKKNFILGSTGWHSQFDPLNTWVESASVSAIYSSNFSVGIYLFRKILAQTAHFFTAFPEYTVEGFDHHHKDKLDAPSGTALDLERLLLQKMNQLSHFPFQCKREGDEIGTHSLKFQSDLDEITLSHKAKDRNAFASGALEAISLLGKRGLYSFEEALDAQVHSEAAL